MSVNRNNCKISNRPSGGGNKLQGLAPKATNFFIAPYTGREYSINSGDGRERFKLININQIGGIGKYRSQFNPSADGINYIKKLYNLPYFNIVLSNLSSGQLSLINYFKTFNYLDIEEDYSYNNNTAGAIIKLYQSDFINGTVRITKPGIYILQENIAFEPNKENDFQPTNEQILSGKYPVGHGGAYHLGFFAAITIETTGVILDLNGKTIEQTLLHSLQQRFYANIELASSPFIPNQGPANLSNSSNYVAGNNVLIKNGILGRSSHHGIHGNTMNNIILQDLIINNFEVAGIALNGMTNGILLNINVDSTSLDVKVLSSYSQARFIRPFLKKIQSTDPSFEFNQTKIGEIITSLENELDCTKDKILAGNPLSSKSIFTNQKPEEGYDGNVYGIVLNINGVVINGLLNERPITAIGNTDIYMENINIKNIISRPLEIVAISPENPSSGAYSNGRQSGPVGDVFDIDKVTNTDNNYSRNVLSDAQLIVAKYSCQYTKLGRTNITKEIVEWAENSDNLTTVMSNNNYYYVYDGDSMGHIMKGNIGLFISGGENIRANKLTINTVKVNGNDVNGSPTKTNPPLGGAANGILITGSNSIKITSQNITNITSENNASNIKKNGINTNIIIK